METIGAVFWMIAAGCIGIWWYREQQKREKRKRRERRIAEFGKNPLELRGAERQRELLEEIRIYYEETKGLLSENQVDEVTWNDLELDEIFFRINHTRSYIGEQTLYRRLHDTGKKESWENWEARLKYFQEEEEGRQKLEEQLERIGKSREDYYLPVFLRNAGILKVEHAYLYRILQILLAGSFLAGVVLGNAVFIAVCIGTALVNVMVYALGKGKYEAYLYALSSVKQLVVFCGMTVENQEWKELFEAGKIVEAVRSLEKLAHLIGNYQVKKRGAWTGDALDILRDYVIGATLWDITVFNRIMRLIDGKQEELFALYEFAGEIDMGISVASFRKSLPGYCLPEFGTRTHICARGVYHPLLQNPVANDFSQQKNCLVTGANASGKSTFIKALAVNAILAQTIHSCTAESLKMPEMRILTSMAVRDDILSGESYYIKEVGYLKRIVEAVQGKIPVFCLIDEILRGTNTAERLAASEAVLRYLLKKNCIAVVATHDMELAERLNGLYDCYYFKSEIRDSDISFDYKIYPGFGENRNAIRLLSYMKFPKEIVDAARKLCG